MDRYTIMDELDVEDLQVNSLLESLSLDMMKDNIINQILGNSSSYTDFFDVVSDKFYTIMGSDDIDSEDKYEIKVQIIDFCHDIILTIANEYNLAINDTSENYQVAIDMVEALYNFFVLFKFDHVNDFYINYIQMNKKPLIDSIGGDGNAKDITSTSYRTKNIPKDDTIILSSLSEIMTFITNSDIVDSEEFLNIINDGSFDVDTLIGYYMDGTLSGNFVPILLNSFIGGDYDNPDFSSLRNNIKCALM